MKCERCKETVSEFITSYFNTQTICLDCSEIERKHPEFDTAVNADIEACLRGDYNFPGIGLPVELER